MQDAIFVAAEQWLVLLKTGLQAQCLTANKPQCTNHCISAIPLLCCSGIQDRTKAMFLGLENQIFDEVELSKGKELSKVHTVSNYCSLCLPKREGKKPWHFKFQEFLSHFLIERKMSISVLFFKVMMRLKGYSWICKPINSFVQARLCFCNWHIMKLRTIHMVNSIEVQEKDHNIVQWFLKGYRFLPFVLHFKGMFNESQCLWREKSSQSAEQLFLLPLDS